MLFRGVRHGFDVTACGQTVPERTVGVLQADLSGFSDTCVTLEDHASLQLNGHTVTGGTFAVHCLENCSVTGPGALSQNTYGIFGDYTKVNNIRVDNVQFDADTAAMVGHYGRFVLTNVAATHSGVGAGPENAKLTAAIAGRRVVGTNVHVTDSLGYGIVTGISLLKLTDSVVTGNNGGGVGIDIESQHLPRLFNTVCGRSLNGGTRPGPFKVCANDP